MEYYSAMKKDGIMPSADMDATTHYHTKWNVRKRKTKPCDITYEWNLNNDTNEPTYEQKQNHWQNRLVVAKGRMDWEAGVSICKLLYIGWINKFLLYSTENYIQYPMINYNGEAY